MLQPHFRRLLRLASVTFAAVLPLSAQAYSDLCVFGDSLPYIGNDAVPLGTDPGQVIADNSYIPTYPCASGRYSNGEVWTVSFAAALGLDASASLTGGNTCAHGGARTRLPSPDFPPRPATASCPKRWWPQWCPSPARSGCAWRAWAGWHC